MTGSTVEDRSIVGSHLRWRLPTSVVDPKAGRRGNGARGIHEVPPVPDPTPPPMPDPPAPEPDPDPVPHPGPPAASGR